MTKWEYAIFAHHGDTQGFEEMLNDYGAAGWELVHLNAFKKGRDAPNTYNLVLKRPLEYGKGLITVASRTPAEVPA